MNGPLPRFVAVDFFCGAGGTTRGLIDAGGYVVAGIDKAAECERTYVENNTNVFLDKAPPVYLNKDIFRVTEDHPNGQFHEIEAELHRLLDPILDYCGKDVPLLFAICAPCQPFSKAAKGVGDKRRAERERDATLLDQTAEFVRIFRPDLVLSENVADIMREKYGGVWQGFEHDLADEGFFVGSAVVNAKEFGVPQSRRRSIMLACHEDGIREGYAFGIGTGEDVLDSGVIALDKSARMHVPEEDPDLEHRSSVRDAIGHFPAVEPGVAHPSVPNHKPAGLTEINRRRLSSLSPGQNNHALTDTPFGNLELPCHAKARSKVDEAGNKVMAGAFSDIYTRMHPDRLAPTITTKCTSISNGRFGHYDTDQVRGITVREAAALQTFPDDYQFFGTSVGDEARMVGNAVPPLLSKWFAHYLVAACGSRRTRDVPNKKRGAQKLREEPIAEQHEPIAA